MGIDTSDIDSAPVYGPQPLGDETLIRPIPVIRPLYDSYYLR
jgi:hypothetical protein